MGKGFASAGVKNGKVGSDTRKGRKARAISLKRFAHAKQHDSSVVRELKQQDARRKAKIVGAYKRMLKEEGYTDVDDDEQVEQKAAKGKDGKGDKQSKKGRWEIFEKDSRKVGAGKDGYGKARNAFNEREAARERAAQSEEERQAIIKKKQKERKRWKQKLGQKTSRGQPILKHKMALLLNQIERNIGN